MKLSYLLLSVLLTAVLMMSGCQSITTTPTASPATTTSVTTAVTTNPASTVPPATSASQTASAVQFPMTITDDVGRSITLKAMPKRLVSLAPSNTEIIFALGLGDQLMGVTKYCNYPAAALTKTQVGGFDDVDIEKVSGCSAGPYTGFRSTRGKSYSNNRGTGYSSHGGPPRYYSSYFERHQLDRWTDRQIERSPGPDGGPAKTGGCHYR